MAPSGGGTPMSSLGSETAVQTSARYTPNSHISMTPSGIHSTPGQQAYGQVHTPLSSQGGSYTPQPMSENNSSIPAHNHSFDPMKVSKLMDDMSKDKLQEILGNLGGINLQQNKNKSSYGSASSHHNPHTPTPRSYQTPKNNFKEPTLPDPSRKQKRGWTALQHNRTPQQYDNRNNSSRDRRDYNHRDNNSRNYNRNSRDNNRNRNYRSKTPPDDNY